MSPPSGGQRQKAGTLRSRGENSGSFRLPDPMPTLYPLTNNLLDAFKKRCRQPHSAAEPCKALESIRRHLIREYASCDEYFVELNFRVFKDGRVDWCGL